MNNEETGYMTTKTYENDLESTIVNMLKELGPISVDDVATLTSSTKAATQKVFDTLRSGTDCIAVSSVRDGDVVLKEYSWKEPMAKEPTKPKILTPKTNQLVDRAYYLMLALRNVNVDLLMDNFDITDKVAEQVLLNMATKYKNHIITEVTCRPKQA